MPTTPNDSSMPPRPAPRWRALAVADGPIPSVDIVIRQPFAEMARRGLIEYELTFEPRSPVRLPSYDLVFMMRSCDAAAREFAHAETALGKRFIYAIDDDFESLDPETPLGRRYRDMRAWENVLALCEIADEVWVFSETLKKKLEPHSRRVSLMPALAHVELVDRLLGEVRPSPARKRLRFGYAAGLTHGDDLAEVAPVIERALERWKGRLEFEVVCVPPGRLARVAGVTAFPCCANVEAFLEFMCERRWDFALAPLRAITVNDSKTDNKYREYSALRIPAIYSRSPVYASSVVEGTTGLLAGSHDEWYAAIERMIEDPGLRASIAERANADVARRYRTEAVVQTYFAAVSEMLGTKRMPATGSTHSLPQEPTSVAAPSSAAVVTSEIRSAVSRNRGRAAEIALRVGHKGFQGFDLHFDRPNGAACAGTGEIASALGTLRSFSWHLEAQGALRVRFHEIVNAHARDLVIRLHSPRAPVFASIGARPTLRCVTRPVAA